MTRLNALSVLQCRDYIAEQHGADALARVRGAMLAAAGEAIYSPLLLATDWVEVELALEHALAYDRLYSATHPREASERMLRALVARHYNGLYRPLLSGAVTPCRCSRSRGGCGVTSTTKARASWSRKARTR